MSTKQLVIETVRRLPDDATLDRIKEEIEILSRIQEAERASAEGRVKPQDEVRQLVREWTAK